MNEVELGVKSFWLVISAGAISGFVSFWFFRRCADRMKLRATGNRILAHLLELRLFAAEPALVMRSQGDLIAANLKFLRLVTLPSVVIGAPFALVLIAMNAIFGRAPLQVGRPAIVTLESRGSGAAGLPVAQLVAPLGIQVETPPVRIPSSSQMSWRVRPLQSVTGELRIEYNGQLVKKSISSSPGLQWLSETRPGSLTSFLLDPLEPPISGSTVKAITVNYPFATVFYLNWLIWFSIASFAGFVVSALFQS